MRPRRQRRRHRRSRKSADPAPGKTSHEEHRAEHHRYQHELAEIGLQRQHANNRSIKAECKRRSRHARRALRLGEKPGGQNNEGRLDELGRLQTEGPEIKPALRAVHRGADHERQQHQQERSGEHDCRDPAHHAQIEQRHADHERDGGHEENKLPVDEVERRQVEAHGDRRARGKCEHRTQHHQAEQAKQRPLVDGPPPLGNRAAVRACKADHAAAPPFTARSSCTTARKTSPRSSKLLNWSKDAQAGESSTTFNSASSAIASREAASTARSSVPQ